MSEVKRYDCTNGKAQYCYGCYQMSEDVDGIWVQAIDYDAAQSELTALREELADETRRADVNALNARHAKQDLNSIQHRLTAAEKQNAELVELLKRVDMTPLDRWYSSGLNVAVFTAIQPTESGSSE